MNFVFCIINLKLFNCKIVINLISLLSIDNTTLFNTIFSNSLCIWHNSDTDWKSLESLPIFPGLRSATTFGFSYIFGTLFISAVIEHCLDLTLSYWSKTLYLFCPDPIHSCRFFAFHVIYSRL